MTRRINLPCFIASCVGLAAFNSAGQGQWTNAPSAASSPFASIKADDGWPDASDFLDQKFGCLPIVSPITEPAVGYGAAGGVTFISEPLGGGEGSLNRPNISMLGGFGTANGSWGAAAGDVRYWLDDRLQTLAGVLYSSVNLDFYGLGNSPVLADNPLRYNLEPVGGMLQGKYRLGQSKFWAGLSYAFAATDVSFEAPAGTPGLPDFRSESDVGGLTPSVTYDTRDNIFTPTHGSYVEASAGFFCQFLGSDTEFQRAQITAMQYFQLHPCVFLGFRGQAGASFGDEPFYLRPAIMMRGIPVMRYQGEEMAQLEAELRWQFWKRISLVGFAGGGGVWNDFEQFSSSRGVVAGGTGLRYEIARKYGLHMGLDVAFGPDTTAVYVQFGSAWIRP